MIQTILFAIDIAFLAIAATLATAPALVAATAPVPASSRWDVWREALSVVLAQAGFCLALAFSRPTLFDGLAPDDSLRFPVLFVAPIAIGVAAMLTVPALHRRMASIAVERVIALQTARVVGGIFIVWAALGQASWPFALIAGTGDLAVGVAAPIVARAVAEGRPGARRLAVAHAAFGLLDFIVAFATAALTRATLAWPGQLIPGFLVPLAILMHVWVLIALRRAGCASEARS